MDAPLPCAGCRGPAPPGDWEGHHAVVPYSQYESAERTLELVDGRLPLAEDPHWRRSGASTAGEYAAWASRTCGLACLRAALAHWTGGTPTTFDLLTGCLPYGAYDAAGGAGSPGLRYRPFLRYLAGEHGIVGEVVESPIGDALAGGALTDGGVLIWSVHASVRWPERAAPDVTGGHLVLVHGWDRSAGTVAFCNPSGHTPCAQAARLPLATFGRFAARRGMVLRPPRP